VQLFNLSLYERLKLTGPEPIAGCRLYELITSRIPSSRLGWSYTTLIIIHKIDVTRYNGDRFHRRRRRI